MTSNYAYDVFVSYSSRDLPQIAEIVERLQTDGLKVWFDQQQSRIPGTLVKSKIDKGLGASRLLLFALSSSTIQSKWLEYESSVFLHHDIANSEGRVIPVLIEDFDIPPHWGVYHRVDLVGRFEEGYAELLEYCRQKVTDQEPIETTEPTAASKSKTSATPQDLLAKRKALFPRLARPQYLK